MVSLKIPMQHFVKIAGGGFICTRGGVFAGHYGILSPLYTLGQEFKLASFPGRSQIIPPNRGGKSGEGMVHHAEEVGHG